MDAQQALSGNRSARRRQRGSPPGPWWGAGSWRWRWRANCALSVALGTLVWAPQALASKPLQRVRRAAAQAPTPEPTEPRAGDSGPPKPLGPVAPQPPPSVPTGSYAPAPPPSLPKPTPSPEAGAARFPASPPARLPTRQAPLLSTAPVAPELDRAPTEARTPRQRQFGVLVDVGVPDGVMASLAYRPHSMVRLKAGIGSNGISTGLRVGGTFLPLGWGPTGTLELGRYSEGDVRSLAGVDPSDPDFAVLERIGYTFFNARLGWEIGHERWVFFVRGGLSHARAKLHELDALVQEAATESTDGGDSQTRVRLPEEPTLKLWAPSFQLGMLFRF